MTDFTVKGLAEQLAAGKIGMDGCDEVARMLVKTMTEYSRSPEKLRRARECLAKIIVSKRQRQQKVP
jgi:hypothetical protein